MIRWNGRGQYNVRAKLTPEKVEEILANPHRLTVAQLAMRYGVSVSCISRVRRGVTWAASEKSNA